MIDRILVFYTFWVMVLTMLFLSFGILTEEILSSFLDVLGLSNEY